MNIVSEKPPHYDKVLAAFPAVADAPYVLFTYGDTIYNPAGKEIQPYTIAHEEVHSRQQAEVGANWWWETYLTDREFRFNEELEAYRIEYKEFCKLYTDRNERSNFLSYLAMNLSGPLYGNPAPLSEVRAKIKA